MESEEKSLDSSKHAVSAGGAVYMGVAALLAQKEMAAWQKRQCRRAHLTQTAFISLLQLSVLRLQGTQPPAAALPRPVA